MIFVAKDFSICLLSSLKEQFTQKQKLSLLTFTPIESRVYFLVPKTLLEFHKKTALQNLKTMEVNGDQFSNRKRQLERQKHKTLHYCASGIIQVSLSPNMLFADRHTTHSQFRQCACARERGSKLRIYSEDSD